MNCGDPRRSGDFLIWGAELETASFCVSEATLFQNDIVAQYSNYSVPTVLIYGCQVGKQHNFSEVQTIYGDEVSKVFSGGIVREWFEDFSSGADLGKINSF